MPEAVQASVPFVVIKKKRYDKRFLDLVTSVAGNGVAFNAQARLLKKLGRNEYWRVAHAYIATSVAQRKTVSVTSAFGGGSSKIKAFGYVRSIAILPAFFIQNDLCH
jgi:hypothetical protein